MLSAQLKLEVAADLIKSVDASLSENPDNCLLVCSKQGIEEYSPIFMHGN